MKITINQPITDKFGKDVPVWVKVDYIFQRVTKTARGWEGTVENILRNNRNPKLDWEGKRLPTVKRTGWSYDKEQSFYGNY